MALAWATGHLDHPLLDLLDDGDRELVLDQSQRQRADAGTEILTQWDDTHEIYLLFSGSVRIIRDGREITELSAGDFFGELATIEWGGGYRYPRLASVMVTEDIEFLVVPGSVVNRLAASVPGLARLLDQSIAERLVPKPL